ncbi:MAG: hypothetical protein ACK4SY_09625, partial [Pyrobaculum sp.]
MEDWGALRPDRSRKRRQASDRRQAAKHQAAKRQVAVLVPPRQKPRQPSRQETRQKPPRQLSRQLARQEPPGVNLAAMAAAFVEEAKVSHDVAERVFTVLLNYLKQHHSVGIFRLVEDIARAAKVSEDVARAAIETLHGFGLVDVVPPGVVNAKL